MIGWQTVVLALAGLCSFPAHAQRTKPDTLKRYNFLNPAPANALRDFSTDRPDMTESPTTVDAGHFQFEADIFKIQRSRKAGGHAYNVMNSLYKIGLFNAWDLHLGVELYNIYQNPEGETISKGYGNTTIRVKHNFWGNSGETRTALGMVPYITFPTSPADDRTSFGIGFPFSMRIGDTLGAGAQVQVDLVPYKASGYRISCFQTFVFGGKLTAKIDFYIEGMVAFAPASVACTANGGLIFNLSRNVKIDVATNLALSAAATARVYTGVSFRI